MKLSQLRYISIFATFLSTHFSLFPKQLLDYMISLPIQHRRGNTVVAEANIHVPDLCTDNNADAIGSNLPKPAHDSNLLAIKFCPTEIFGTGAKGVEKISSLNFFFFPKKKFQYRRFFAFRRGNINIATKDK